MSTNPDPFFGMPPGVLGPATKGFAITPDDNIDMATYARRIYVGGTGDLVVELRDMPQGSSVTLKSVPVGLYELWVRRVHATGTTATNLVGLN